MFKITYLLESQRHLGAMNGGLDHSEEFAYSMLFIHLHFQNFYYEC